MEEQQLGAALDKSAAELSVMDVYDIAAALGLELERVIERTGAELLSRLVPRVVRVLELLEVLVSRSSSSPDTDELRLELDRLRLERLERLEKEKKHKKELELVEDVWRGEAQDLLGQISQLQEENKTLLNNLSIRESPLTEEDIQKQEGMTERERQVMKKLKEVVDKQRDEIRAKDRELTLKNDDVEALQQQMSRLMKINQDVRHRVSVVEAQGKSLIQQKVELEAAAQTQQQEVSSLRQEVSRLKEKLKEQSRNNEEEAQEPVGPPSPAQSCKVAPPWGQDLASELLAGGLDLKEVPLHFLPSAVTDECEDEEDEDEDERACFWEALCDDDLSTVDLKDPNRPRFTLQELRDVLHERNELKAKVFMLQEEIAYYKSEEQEEENGPPLPDPSETFRTNPRSNFQPESGIKRLIFTAIMPMVAAGLIADDPTLQPIRRLISLV
ncbi:RILP-like protein 1 isoform X2 [Danio aesculapii]|uniref:RILP-like protein 1 isoform X2 n=1 Tax=Danio aesculapii TaxID=1142201 RepID=UPI0024C05064|nr:RILP-like protein 1 isoform X2 [Danio aesculapii]